MAVGERGKGQEKEAIMTDGIERGRAPTRERVRMAAAAGREGESGDGGIERWSQPLGRTRREEAAVPGRARREAATTATFAEGEEGGGGCDYCGGRGGRGSRSGDHGDGIKAAKKREEKGRSWWVLGGLGIEKEIHNHGYVGWGIS